MPWRDVVTDDTGIMLQELVKRKEKLDKMTARHTLYVFLTLALLGLLVVSIYLLQQEQYTNPFSIISDNTFFIIAAASTIVAQNYYYRKKEKAKEKFHKLRVEVIDHLKHSWYINLRPELIDQIVAFMSENHDINVSFKAK